MGIECIDLHAHPLRLPSAKFILRNVEIELNDLGCLLTRATEPCRLRAAHCVQLWARVPSFPSHR
jgi:hypothetical protein